MAGTPRGRFGAGRQGASRAAVALRLAREKRCDRELPALAKRGRQTLGRVVTPLSRRSASLGTNVIVYAPGTGHGLGHELRRKRRHATQAPVLPGCDKRAGGIVVDDRCPSRSEGDPPAGALAAALDRPGGWGTAAGAPGSFDPDEPPTARLAERSSRHTAHRTRAREDQVEQSPPASTGPRLRGNSRPRSDRSGPRQPKGRFQERPFVGGVDLWGARPGASSAGRVCAGEPLEEAAAFPEPAIEELRSRMPCRLRRRRRRCRDHWMCGAFRCIHLFVLPFDLLTIPIEPDVPKPALRVG